MEYAVAVLNAPLILVLGRDACGAGRCDRARLGGIYRLTTGTVDLIAQG